MAAPFSSWVHKNEEGMLTRTCRGKDSSVQRGLKALGRSSWVQGLYSRAVKRLLLG